MGIYLVSNYEQLLDILEDNYDESREWVLQEYLSNPLVLPVSTSSSSLHKFHLRVYVLAVGALRVFVFNNILMLFAAHPYTSDMSNMYAHLTNTAKAAENVDFEEKKFVKVLDDLPEILLNHLPERFQSIKSANDAVSSIKNQIYNIVSDLFDAYENEYSIFCPASQSFELYGLDFIIEDHYSSEDSSSNIPGVDSFGFKISLLEVNPGPDFKQTGDRLKSVIFYLWEQTLRIVVDSNLLASALINDQKTIGSLYIHNEVDNKLKNHFEKNCPDFSLVYSKEWSVSNIKGNMKLDN